MSDRVKLLAYRLLDPAKPAPPASKPQDLTPQIAARAYELYDQRVHGVSPADQDWQEAEREIQDEMTPKG